jgi:hypothetical protein
MWTYYQQKGWIMDTDFRIVFTHHARERMIECQVDYKKAIWLLQTATQEKAPDSAYKQSKYSDQENVTYWRNGSVIFTTIATTSKFNPDEPIILVLTMTEQQAVARLHTKRGLTQAKRRATYEENRFEYDSER